MSTSAMTAEKIGNFLKNKTITGLMERLSREIWAWKSLSGVLGWVALENSAATGRLFNHFSTQCFGFAALGLAIHASGLGGLGRLGGNAAFLHSSSLDN